MEKEMYFTVCRSFLCCTDDRKYTERTVIPQFMNVNAMMKKHDYADFIKMAEWLVIKASASAKVHAIVPYVLTGASIVVIKSHRTEGRMAHFMNMNFMICSNKVSYSINLWWIFTSNILLTILSSSILLFVSIEIHWENFVMSFYLEQSQVPLSNIRLISNQLSRWSYCRFEKESESRENVSVIIINELSRRIWIVIKSNICNENGFGFEYLIKYQVYRNNDWKTFGWLWCNHK